MQFETRASEFEGISRGSSSSRVDTGMNVRGYSLHSYYLIVFVNFLEIYASNQVGFRLSANQAKTALLSLLSVHKPKKFDVQRKGSGGSYEYARGQWPRFSNKPDVQWLVLGSDHRPSGAADRTAYPGQNACDGLFAVGASTLSGWNTAPHTN
jgi:hypothetical protein